MRNVITQLVFHCCNNSYYS